MTLYGFAASNYYNIVKHTLLAKEIDFTETVVYTGNKGDDYLSKSPMGKVPCIETEQGCLSESSVIIDYLEDAYPEKPLYPSDPFARAKVRQITKIAELYIELPARRHIPEVVAKTPRLEEAYKEAGGVIKKGLRALDRLRGDGQFLFGDKLTYADIYTRYCLKVGKLVGYKIYDWDILEDFERLKAWDRAMAEDPISRKVDADAAAAQEAFFAKVRQQT
ncbi:glutathione S-transferase family protein [Exilibacterium tricleocarpae]|uniref:Glutathione S-transferase family protein n=1 Tax=Exilibacterium tricleocarpae TaxID=2591008 RepID=A0A545TM11_9GAMM|nr:glutathione S-transferase family protein [Exilibacterium tricleocarpae]